MRIVQTGPVLTVGAVACDFDDLHHLDEAAPLLDALSGLSPLTDDERQLLYNFTLLLARTERRIAGAFIAGWLKREYTIGTRSPQT